MVRLLFTWCVSATILAATCGFSQGADLNRPLKAPPIRVFDVWNGGYIGANIGYTWDTSGFPLTLPPTSINLSAVPQGVTGGAQLGYGFHNGPFYAGLETDINAMNAKGTSSVPGLLTVNGSMDYFGTVRARLGLVIGDMLVYGTGGYAYGKTNACFDMIGSSACGGGGRSGWAFGGGVEHTIYENWTAKLEYLRVDLGTATIADPATSIVLTPSFQADIVRGGVNYHF